MDWLLNILIFLGSCFLLYLSGEWVVAGLIRAAKFLGWREFIVAFLIMAIGTSLPNFFVGITSAIQDIPHLSLGDVLGNNLIVLTLAVALGIFFTPKKEIPTASRTVQTTAFFTMIMAITPLLLISDGILSRGDGLILIGFFVFYISWLFAKKERFISAEENNSLHSLSRDLKNFLKDFIKIIAGIALLFLASQGIIYSASFFAVVLGAPLILIGVLIVGFGSALPEIYFAIAAARRRDTWLILGNLMGSVIMLSTLVLGIVALIHPINIFNSLYNWEILVLSRTFVILAGLLFFVFSRTNRKITIKEAYVLCGVYLIFVISAIWLL